MPRYILSTTAPGTDDAWGFVGADSSWEAVAYGSGDSSYITAAAGALVSDFFCGAGSAPTFGHVMAVTLHYRLRVTTANPGDVDLEVVQSGTPRTAGNVALSSTAWQDGEIRIRSDWTSTQRFTLPDLAALGVRATANTIPASGEIQISEMYLAVEYIESYWQYDPFSAVTPDAISGDLAWVKNGAIVPSFVNDYLRMDDTGAAVCEFSRSMAGVPAQKAEYVSEVEMRVALSNLEGVPNSHVCRLVGLREDERSVLLSVVKLSSTVLIGLHTEGSDPLDQGDYFDIAQLDITNDFHVRVTIDRDDTNGTAGKVEVFVNYAETPLLSAHYALFIGAPVANATFPFFATNYCRLDLDYVWWNSYKKRGSAFNHWMDGEQGSNEIAADNDDSAIVKQIWIEPPGVMAGQSDYVCVLDVQEPTYPCEIFQTERLPAAGPPGYNLALDYRMDTAATEGEVTVQRVSDLHYWNGAAWQPGYSAQTLAYQTDRTRASVMTGIAVATANDGILVGVRRKTAVGGSYKILVYKVHLEEGP